MRVFSKKHCYRYFGVCVCERVLKAKKINNIACLEILTNMTNIGKTKEIDHSKYFDDNIEL